MGEAAGKELRSIRGWVLINLYDRGGLEARSEMVKESERNLEGN